MEPVHDMNSTMVLEKDAMGLEMVMVDNFDTTSAKRVLVFVGETRVGKSQLCSSFTGQHAYVRKNEVGSSTDRNKSFLWKEKSVLLLDTIGFYDTSGADFVRRTQNLLETVRSIDLPVVVCFCFKFDSAMASAPQVKLFEYFRELFYLPVFLQFAVLILRHEFPTNSTATEYIEDSKQFKGNVERLVKSWFNGEPGFVVFDINCGGKLKEMSLLDGSIEKPGPATRFRNNEIDEFLRFTTSIHGVHYTSLDYYQTSYTLKHAKRMHKQTSASLARSLVLETVVVDDAHIYPTFFANCDKQGIVVAELKHRQRILSLQIGERRLLSRQVVNVTKTSSQSFIIDIPVGANSHDVICHGPINYNKDTECDWTNGKAYLDVSCEGVGQLDVLFYTFADTINRKAIHAEHDWFMELFRQNKDIIVRSMEAMRFTADQIRLSELVIRTREYRSAHYLDDESLTAILVSAANFDNFDSSMNTSKELEEIKDSISN